MSDVVFGCHARVAIVLCSADFPAKLAAEGKIANVPVIYGTNGDEGTIFNKCPKDLPADQYQSYVIETCVPASPCGSTAWRARI